jgi:hypothetical protein
MSQTFLSPMRVPFRPSNCPSTGLGRYRVICGSTATTYTPEPGSPTHDAMTLLASWAASTAHGSHSGGRPNDLQQRHGEQGRDLPSGSTSRPDDA